MEQTLIKFVTLVVGCHSERTVSQIFYLGPSFYFMKSRNLCSIKIEILRHDSLQMNIIYKITKLQSWGYDSKSEILIQKIKVKNWILIHIF